MSGRRTRDELLKSAGRVHALARELGASIDYDSIGVGAFTGAHFQALNEEFKTRIDYFQVQCRRRGAQSGSSDRP